MTFEFDYSRLNASKLVADCITTDEIEFIFHNQKSKFVDSLRVDGLGFFIGFSNRRKFLSFYFKITKQNKARITEAYLSYETEIESIYFQK